jgi:hypothetical protein
VGFQARSSFSLRGHFAVSGFFALLLAGALADCGGVKQCNATTCATGCCDSAGICRDGNAEQACGGGGQACAACGASQSCSAQACANPGATPNQGGSDDGSGDDAGNDSSGGGAPHGGGRPNNDGGDTSGGTGGDAGDDGGGDAAARTCGRQIDTFGGTAIDDGFDSYNWAVYGNPNPNVDSSNYDEVELDLYKDYESTQGIPGDSDMSAQLSTGGYMNSADCGVCPFLYEACAGTYGTETCAHAYLATGGLVHVDQADQTSPGRMVATMTNMTFTEWDFDKDVPVENGRCITVAHVSIDASWSATGTGPTSVSTLSLPIHGLTTLRASVPAANVQTMVGATSRGAVRPAK